MIHFDDPKSSMMFTNNNNSVSRANSPPRAPASSVLMNNNSQSNIPTHSLKNLMSETLNGSGALFGMSNSSRISRSRPQVCTSVFDLDHNSKAGVAASTYNPSPTTDHLQPMRFSSVGDTTSLLNRQIPDDTKNSIVELLNEIWKYLFWVVGVCFDQLFFNSRGTG